LAGVGLFCKFDFCGFGPFVFIYFPGGRGWDKWGYIAPADASPFLWIRPVCFSPAA
jgi:hypothetical protein